MDRKIGIIGATGSVGTELINLLEEYNIVPANLRLFASEHSVGKKIHFHGVDYDVESLSEDKLYNLDYAFFCSDAEVSRQYVPIAASHGVCCIDNSSAFRTRPDIPLIVPEINAYAISHNSKIIANPNCSTIIAMMALAPLHRTFTLSGFCVSTYQAVSGMGNRGIQALRDDIDGESEPAYNIFGAPIAYNAIPQIGMFQEHGYTSEECKMLYESRKILNDDQLRVSATCVRIPVWRAHAMSITAQFINPLTISHAIEILENTPGVKYFHDPEYPTPLKQSKKNDIAVGRLRLDTFLDNALSLWVVGDQIRKGAALNALQIMQCCERKFQA